MDDPKQQGFTLIELVTTIVILGALSAMAIPRFINLQSNARNAVINSAAGAVASAAMLAQSAWLTAGGAASITTVTMSGNTVNVNASGYPTAAAAGIGAAINRSNDILLGADAAAPATGAYTISYSDDGTTAVANCNFIYSASTGQITTVTTIGC
jgi:MSHA pilin protein MshA